MIKFVDFKLEIGEKKLENEIIEDEAGWQRGQIETKTGIKKRFISSKSSEELAFDAIKKIKKNKWIKDIDLVISVTNTPTTIFPNFSNYAHTFLDLKENCKCLGLNSGCTGFVEALELVNFYFQNGFKKALIITFDTYAKFLAQSDFSTRALFSDGASVTLLEKNTREWKIKLSKVSTAKNTQNSLNMKKKLDKISMHGPSVFAFGIKYVIKDIKNIVSRHPNTVCMFHQAGKVMLDGLIKSLPSNIIAPLNYHKYGNLVSTSIPCLMMENFELVNDKKSMLISGFGVGLSSHSLLLTK